MTIKPASMPAAAASLGVDYSATVLYLACVTGSKVNRVMSLKLPEPVDIIFLRLLSNTLTSFIYDFQVDEQLWIEHPWVNGQHFPLSGIKLARTAAILEAESVFVGLTPKFVYPMAWRKDIYGKGRPENRKDLAVEYVKEKFDYDVPVMGKTGRGITPDHNFAEAILIAHYGNKRIQNA